MRGLFSEFGLNGLELAHVCKCNKPDLKIIMARGHTQEKIRREHPVQPDLLCQKPFTFELILMAVRELLGEKPHAGSGG